MNPVNRKRQAKEKPRTFGDKARRAWMVSQPCCVCGKPGPSQQHHVRTGGMGRKSDYTETVPICWECHDGWHRSNPPLDTVERRDRVKQLPPEYEAAWQRHIQEAA